MSTGERGHGDALQRLIAQFGTFYFDERRHRMSLPLLARWLHVDARDEEALKLLLRYWRTGGDGVPDRLLEASIRLRLSGARAALPALRRAFVIDPTDPVVQGRLLQGLADAGERREAKAVASKLLGSARDPDVLAAALAAGDAEWQVFGAADLDGRQIEGWAAWRGDAPERAFTLVADGRSAPFTVDAQPHPAWARHAARFGRFRIAWPTGAAIVEVRDAATGTLLRGAPMMNDEILDTPRSMLLHRDASGQDVDVTIIVPVYADAAATRACFESLAADRATTTRRRVIAVDDASPDAMIRALLDRLAASGQIVLLRNPQNVGFIRAVNRALKLVGQEDVVLLNADTATPPGWLDRLRAAAMAPDVGTVTPLSNNGEFVSVPNGFRANPMPGRAQLLELDAAAQRLGGGVVDMPNGVGFCLFVRNDALRAVGGLDARHYERGYLEEVDFCLRVAQAGYRNVCTTDLFVAHQGEASFGASKRALVVANASALVRRWPRIEAETEAFVKGDPLRRARQALAWPSLPRGRRRRLVIAGAGGLDTALSRRLEEDAASLEIAVLAAPNDAPSSWTCRWLGLDDAVPLPEHSVQGDVPDALAWAVETLSAEDVVLVQGRDTPAGILAAIPGLGAPFDVLPLAADRPLAPALAAAARRLLLPTPSARALSGGVAVACLADLPVLAAEPLPRAGFGEAMGILPGDASPATFALIRDLARALHRRGSSRSLVVFGETFRDVGLLRLGNVFVTGPLEEEDWPQAFAAHPCGGLILTLREPLTAHPAYDIVRRAGLPFAAYPVGAGADLLAELPDGLALDPGWTVEQLALVADTFLSASALSGLARAPAEVA